MHVFPQGLPGLRRRERFGSKASWFAHNRMAQRGDAGTERPGQAADGAGRDEMGRRGAVRHMLDLDYAIQHTASRYKTWLARFATHLLIICLPEYVAAVELNIWPGTC